MWDSIEVTVPAQNWKVVLPGRGPAILHIRAAVARSRYENVLAQHNYRNVQIIGCADLLHY